MSNTTMNTSTGLNNFTLGDLIAGFNQNGMGICIIGLPERSLNNFMPAILPQSSAQATTPAPTPASILPPIALGDVAKNADSDVDSDVDLDVDADFSDESIPEIPREKSLNIGSQRILRGGKTLIVARKQILRPKIAKKIRNSIVVQHKPWTPEEEKKLQNYTSDYTIAPDADFARKIASVLTNRSPNAIRAKVSRMMRKLGRDIDTVFDNDISQDTSETQGL